MVRARKGIGRLGCLVLLLVAAVVVHVGLGFAEAYWRYFRYRDAMAQSARFASERTDDAIRRQLAGVADSLGLPPEAQQVRVRREGGLVSIEARYTERVRVPGTEREVHFNPRVEQR